MIIGFSLFTFALAALGPGSCPPAPWKPVASDYLAASEIPISVLMLRRRSLAPHADPPMPPLVHNSAQPISVEYIGDQPDFRRKSVGRVTGDGHLTRRGQCPSAPGLRWIPLVASA